MEQVEQGVRCTANHCGSPHGAQEERRTQDQQCLIFILFDDFLCLGCHAKAAVSEECFYRERGFFALFIWRRKKNPFEQSSRDYDK